MGWGGRSLALFSLATLLLISASAVSGYRHVEDLERFGRSGRDHGKDVSTEGNLAAKKVLEAVSFDENKPAEGILEKARSFLSGVLNPIGNGILPFEKKKLARTEEEGKRRIRKEFARAEEDENSDIRRHFGRHHGLARSRWAGIRHFIRNHPERLADISATEPINGLDGTSDSELQGQLSNVMELALAQYLTGNVPVIESEDTTCAGLLEVEVKTLVKIVISTLRESLCHGDVASMEVKRFCNAFEDHPMLAALEVFAKTSTNPINLIMEEKLTCSQVNTVTEYMDSLNEMERLALKALLSPEVRDNEDMHMGHDRERLMFHKHRHEHKDHERHWWQWMLPKQHLFINEEHHKEEKHEWHQERKAGEHVHEHKERQWWQRMFPMFHEHRRQHGFKHAQMKSGNDCYSRSVRYLYGGIRNYLATTCQTATSPNVISACKFAKEHRFLVKTWLAVKVPVWSEAAKKCSYESLPPNFAELEKETEAGHVPVNPIYLMETAPHSIEGMMQRFISRSSARKRANPALNKALHLREHAVGISHRDDGVGLPGLIRTHLVVLREHSRPHHHVGEEVVDISELLDRLSSGDVLSEIQDRLEALKGEALIERQTVSDMAEKIRSDSFQHHSKGFMSMHRNFRISANPRGKPTSDGVHFICAKPGHVDIVDTAETESTGMSGSDAGSEVGLRMRTAEDTIENRADM